MWSVSLTFTTKKIQSHQKKKIFKILRGGMKTYHRHDVSGKDIRSIVQVVALCQLQPQCDGNNVFDNDLNATKNKKMCEQKYRLSVKFTIQDLNKRKLNLFG